MHTIQNTQHIARIHWFIVQVCIPKLLCAFKHIFVCLCPRGCACLSARVCSYMQPEYTYTCMHARTHTHAHAASSHTHVHVHSHGIHGYMHTNRRTHMRTCITELQACTLACMRANAGVMTDGSIKSLGFPLTFYQVKSSLHLALMSPIVHKASTSMMCASCSYAGAKPTPPCAGASSSSLLLPKVRPLWLWSPPPKPQKFRNSWVMNSR